MRCLRCLIITCLLTGCLGKRPKEKIFLQPYQDIPARYVELVKDSLLLYFNEVSILQTRAIPAAAWYEPRKRFRAEKILQQLARYSANDHIVGLTTKDISTNKNGNDWGVMGLGILNGNVCVASTFRLGQKNIAEQLFKVAIHELGIHSGYRIAQKSFAL